MSVLLNINCGKRACLRFFGKSLKYLKICAKNATFACMQELELALLVLFASNSESISIVW